MSKSTRSMSALIRRAPRAPARRRAHEAERQNAELVRPHRRRGKVEPFDDDDALLEQRAVRAVMPRVKLLDREIVDADELDAERDEILRAVRREVGVVVHELRAADEGRVARLDQDARVPLELVPLELRSADGHHVVRDADEDGGAHEDVERQRVDGHAVVEEVLGRVDVCAGVRSKRERRHVRALALGDLLLRRDPDRRDCPGYTTPPSAMGSEMS